MKIRIFFVLTLVLSVIHSGRCIDDYEALASSSFGAISSTLETGLLPKQFKFSDKSLKSGFSVASILPQVIKGQVDPRDKLVNAVANMTRVFNTKLSQVGAAIVRESKKIHASLPVSNFINEMQIETSHLAKRTAKMLKYNISADDLDALRFLCFASDSDPEKLIEVINATLIRPCATKLTKEEEKKFTECLKIMEPHKFSIQIKMTIALYCSQRIEEAQNIIDRYLKIIGNTDNHTEEILQDAVKKLDGENNNIYLSTCLLHSVYFENGCDRSNLVNFITLVNNMFHPLVFGSLVCSILYSDESKKKEYIQEIETSLDIFIQFQSDYFDSSMSQSFNLCHSTVIQESIRAFQPQGKVKSSDYQALGNNIIKELSKHGSNNELRHIVVSPNLDMNTKYFPSCPLGNCKVFHESDKEISVFYSANQPSDSALEINLEFFTPANLNLIEKFIYEKSNEEYLDTIRQYLSSKNLSLTNSDRFMSEVWIRQWSALGDCPLETSVTTSGESENYPFLPYYWRNWGKAYDCENFRIYVFP